MAMARRTNSRSSAPGTRAEAPEPSTARSTRRSHSLFRSGLAITFGLVIAAATMLGTAPAPASAAVVPGVVDQCNGIANVGGQAVECEVTVRNFLDLTTKVSSSVIVARACTGAAGAALTCTTTPVQFPTATTVIDQCNGSGQGGGATVTCTVRVINTITGNATATPATVNQCVGSGGGGGTQPTLDCDPVQSTTNATITQCNGAANGGGATRRVSCTVQPSTQSTALPVTITQCNNDNVTAPGSLVTCTATLTNRILPAEVTPTPVPSATPTATPTPTSTPAPTSTPTPTGTPTPSPSTPGNPETPGTPENPGTPGNPEGPGTPGNPENPGTPGNPETPGTPGAPGPSDTPTPTPTDSATPGVPVAPTPTATSPASPLVPSAGGGTGDGSGNDSGDGTGNRSGNALAETGVNAQPVFFIAAGALLVGAVLLAVTLVRRRNGADHGPTTKA